MFEERTGQENKGIPAEKFKTVDILDDSNTLKVTQPGCQGQNDTSGEVRGTSTS